MSGSSQSEIEIERKWRTKLRRLRFDAEPLEEQLAKYRRTTVALTIVPSIIALVFLGIFTAFRRPDVGLIGVLVIFAPVVAIAWLDHWILTRRVAEYLKYRRESSGS